MEDRYNVLQKYAVKISYKGDFGSGVIFNAGEKTVILTAAHVIDYSLELNGNDLSLARYINGREDNIDFELISSKCDELNDLAVLEIKSSEIFQKIEFENPKIDQNVKMYGYPSALAKSNDTKTYGLEGKVSEINGNKICVKLNEKLGSFVTEEITTIKGYSGSGFYSVCDEQVKLYGIETKALEKDVLYNVVVGVLTDALLTICKSIGIDCNTLVTNNVVSGTVRPYVSNIGLSPIEKMKRILSDQKKVHPSFRLLANGQKAPDAKADPSIFPKGIEPDKRFMVYKDNNNKESEPIRITEFIAKSWKTGIKRHLQIQGIGGIGKTVTLLSLATEGSYLSRNVPAVYIPMYNLNDYAKEDGISEYIKNIYDNETLNEIDKLSKAPWDNGPNLLLLLDGFNEVALKEKQSIIWADIKRWADRKGVQIITTSRSYIGGSATNFTPIILQKLDKDTIINYIKDYNTKSGKNVRVPKVGERLFDLLSIPLMLTIYLQVGDIDKLKKEYPYLNFKKNTNAGNLINNFIQKEIYNYSEYIGNNQYIHKIDEFVFIMSAVVPYIMYEMEQDGFFAVSESYVKGKIADALSYYKQKYFCIPSQAIIASNLENDYFGCSDKDDTVGQSNKNNIFKRLDINEVFVQITQRSSIFSRSVNSNGISEFRPMHQDFRDGLAAQFLCNIGLSHADHKEGLPEEYMKLQGYYVVNFMCEILCLSEIKKLWEMNRLYKPTSVYGTLLLLNIIRRKTQGDYRNISFEGMDLTNIPLHSYFVSGKMPARDKLAFKGAKISEKTLVSQGHTAAVKKVLISPNGRRLISGSSDGSVKVWDIENGVRIYNLQFEGVIYAMSLSADGHNVISVSSGGRVHIWDLESGSLLDEFYHDNGIRNIACCKDGRIAISILGYRDIDVYDNNFEEYLGSFHGHTNEINALVASSYNNTFISGSSDQTVKLWGNYDQCLLDLKPKIGDIESLSVSSGGKLLAIGSDRGILQIRDLKNKKSVQANATSGSSVKSLDLSNDGNILVSGSSNGLVQVWNTENGKCIAELSGHTAEVNSIALSADGHIAVSGSADKSLRIWDLEKKACVQVLRGSDDIMQKFVLNTECGLIVDGLNDGTLRIWDTYKESCKFIMKGHIGKICALALSNDGRIIVSRSTDNRVLIWDVKGKKCKYALTGRIGDINELVISGDGRIVVTSSHNKLRVWDIENRRLVKKLYGFVGETTALAISGDGRTIVGGQSNGKLIIWKYSETKHIKVMDCAGFSIIKIAVSSDGRTVAIGLSTGELHIWDTETENCIKRIHVAIGHISALAMNNDCSIIIGGYRYGRILVYNAKTGAHFYKQSESLHSIDELIFNKDGSVTISESSEKVIRTWIIQQKDLLNNNNNISLCKLCEINPFYDINLYGMDFRGATFINNKIKRRCKHSGAIVDN